MNIEVRSISDLPELALVDVFQWPTLSLLQHHVGDSLSTPADPDRPRPVGQFSFTTPVASMEYTPPLRTTSSKTGPTEKEMRESMEQTVTQLCSQLEALDEEEQRPQRSLYSLRSALLRSLVTTLKEKGETEMESSFQMGREAFNNTIAIHPSNETRYDGRPDDGKPNKIILYVYNNSLSKGWLRETILEQLNEVGARDMVTRTAVSLTLLSSTETRASEAFFELFTIIVQRSTFDFDDKKCVKEMRECLFPLLYLVQHGSWTTETLCGLSTLIAWLPTPPASEETETFQVVNQLRVSLNPKREPQDTGNDEPHHPHHAVRVGMPLDSSLSDLSNISLQSSSAVRSSALQEPISEQRAEETEDAASSVGGSDGGPTIHRTVALSNDFFRHRLREFHESFRSWFSPVFSVDPTTHVKMHFLSSTDCDHIYLVLLPPTVTPDDLATKREPIASRLASPDRDSVVEMTGGTVAVLLSDRKRGDLTRQPYPRFEAQVTLTNTKTLDTSVTGEWHELVQNLRVILARQLLHTIRTSDTGCAPFKGFEVLFGGGRRGSDSLPAVEAGMSMLDISDEELSKKVMCLKRNLPTVREVLRVLEYFFQIGAASWSSPRWQEVVKIVSLNSANLSSPEPKTTADYIIANIKPPAIDSVSEVVQSVLPLFSTEHHRPISELEGCLTLAEDSFHAGCAFLQMISKVVEEKMTDKNAFLFSRTAALMYRFMQLKKENYMDPFTGRGREQERCIRKLICGIVSRLLHLQSEAYGVCGESTVEFIEKPWTYAPFSSIALSFLTFPFDPVDTATLYRDEMVSRHFPRRPHILDACEEYPSGLTIVNEVLHPDRPCEVNMLNMLAVTKTPGMFVSSPSAVFSRSKEPVFSPDASGPRQSMSIQVKIDDAGSPSFYVGLASGMVTLRAPDMRSDTQGLFWTAKGTLRYQLSEYHFPPLFERDEISFDVFYLCDKWRIAVSMNHCELGVFDAPNVPLYLVAGHTDNADHHTLYKVSIRSLYGDEETGRAPSEEEEEESEVSRQDSASSRPDLSNVVALSTFEHQVVGVPKDLTARSSRYNFHAFSALILRYLSTKLSKQFLQHQREVGVGVNDEEVRRGAMVKEMLDSCSSRLLENADAVLKLVDSTENPLFTSEARKWRLLFYNDFLLGIVVPLTYTLKGHTTPVVILNMLTRIICNDAVSDRIKCIALSSIHRTIENNLPGEKDTDRETRTVLGDYDPAPLWAYCQRLAADMTQDVYRPTFGTRTVPSAVAVLRGGRRAEHKPGGPNRPPKSVVYAREGIPLDGSLGNEVSFSCRIQRTIVAESLGRYYYVGVACVKPSDSQQATNDDGGHELNYYPGVRLKQPFVYDITDSIKVENNLAVVTALRRHEDHWLSKEDQLVFGSGDIITVTVNCAQRSVAFARNGKSLGTVYNKGIAPLVTVLYPCVELYNKDSSVTWMYHIRELSVLARYTMRVMLQCWQTELIEPLKQLLSRSREGVCTALQVLGSDGEELAATYHAPPSADVVSTSHNVRIIRMEEGWTTIEDDAGTLLQVTSGAVEPDYLSRVSIDFADKMDVLLLLLDLVKDLIQMEDPNRIVVAHRHVLVRVLRLLSEWTPDYMTAMVENPLPPTAGDGSPSLVKPPYRALLESAVNVFLQLIRPKSVDLPSSTILSEAWNEICFETETTPLLLQIEEDSSAEECEAPGEDDQETTLRELLCPSCDTPWSACQSGDHPAPATPCALYDMLLRQKGVASPYTGWITTWESCVESPSSSSYEDVDSAEEEEDEGNAQEGHLIPVTTCITFEEDQEKGHPWLVGAGECKTGRFKVSGRLLSSTVFEGGVTFEMDPTDTAAPAEEEGWSCEACTFINEADAIRCNMCGTPKFGATWVCGACSYAYNGDHDPRCSMCNTLRTGQARGSSGAAKLSRCQTCKNTFDYVGLENLCLRAYCDVCKAVTEWLPVNSIRGTLKCHLTDGGDLMEGEIVLEGMRAGITGMVAKSYSEEALRALVVTHTPCEEKNYIYPLLQPHHHLSTCVARQDGFSLQQRLPSALVHYASRLVLLCAPYVKPDVIRNPRTIQDLGIDEEGWLDHLNILPREQARRSLATCLQVLLVKADSARCVHTAATLARSLLKSDKEFESQKHYFLYVLGMNALNVNKPTTVREECYRSMNHLFEDFVGSFMNSRCLVDAMGYLPTVGEQQRTTVFARLNGAPVTNVSSSTKAVYALVKLMDAMKHKTPLPRLLEHNVGVVLPHVVALADTQVNEAGDLLSGQVRGNIGVSAHQKGKYYFEMVVPPTVDERVVMGWGTLLHEQEASFQHVGADNHSWGFDCRDRLRIIGDEQRLRIVPPSAGDVIGSYVDMQSLTVAWSVNGREVGKVSMPYSGSSEIYPYVSGAVAPNAVQVRLTNTQFKPDGYSDYTFDDAPLWELNETAEPQDYEFYRSLCCLLEEANVTEVPSLKRLTKWLKASSHHSLWSKYPAVQRVLTSQSWSAEKLLYYIQVLQAVSDITVTVSHGFYIVENSPYLTQVYKKATSLLSSTSRWILFDTQVSSKLSVYMPHPRDVSLSIHVAQTIYDDNNSLLRFIYSVTYQLFSQLENAPVYRFPVMFVVNLWDYETIDVGGVTRSVLSMISDELNYRVENGTRIDPVLPLFKLCDHSSVFTIVPNSVDFMTEDDSLPDGETYANLQQRLLTWIGKLMGNIVLRGTLKLPLALPRLAWKYLTYDTPVIEDYFFDIDDKMRNSLLDDAFLMDTELYYSIPGVGRLQEEAIRYLASAPAVASPTSPLSPRRNSLLSSVTPTLSSSDLAEYEPPAQGGEEPVSEVERRRKIAEYALLHQYDVSLGAIRSGLASVIPPSALRNVRYGDLQTRVCGLSSVSAEQVLAFTDCSSLPEEVYGFFKKAITDLTDAGRSQFLLFCSGQRRLPLPEKIYVSCGDDPNLIPTAHTCSPISLLIQPYATLEQMKEKLNWSLYHGKEFGFA